MKKNWKAIIMQAFIFSILLMPCITSLAGGNVMDTSSAAVGMVEMGDGSFLTTDSYNKVIWKQQNGISEIYAGMPGVPGIYGEPQGGYRDDSLSQALFGSPWAIVPFKGGYAVSDPANNVVRLIYDNKVRTVNLKVALSNPTGLAVDGDGALYISDTNNNIIRRVTKEGSVTTWLTGLSEPTGLYFKNGLLYIADSGNNRILKAESGNISAVIGGMSEGYGDGDYQQAMFANPMGLAVDDDGTIYVADTGNSAIRKIQTGAVTTLLINRGTELSNVPVSPVGLLLKGDSLYMCDMFSRTIIAIPKEEDVNQ